MNALADTLPAAPAFVQAIAAEVIRQLMAGGLIRPPAPALPAVTLREAVSATLEAKRGHRPAYVRSLRQYLGLFIRGRETTQVSTVTPSDLEEWFSEREEAPAVRASNIGRLGALFTLARRKGWIAMSPVDGVDRIRVEAQVPRIFTAAQVGTFFRWVKAHRPIGLAHFSLNFFVGTRPEETLRLSWESLDLDRAVLTVDGAASKVRQRRVVRLEETAVAWLKYARNRKVPLPISSATARRIHRQARIVLGLDRWPQDAARHTAASMLLAKIGDAGKVAMMLGNSADILLRHYHELVPEDEARTFWSLRP